MYLHAFSSTASLWSLAMAGIIERWLISIKPNENDKIVLRTGMYIICCHCPWSLWQRKQELNGDCTHHSTNQMPCLPFSKRLGQIRNFEVVNQERTDCWRCCSSDKSIKHQPAGIGSRETKNLHKYNQTKWKQKLTSDVIHHVTNSTGKALEDWRSRVQTWLRIMTAKFRNSHAGKR